MVTEDEARTKLCCGPLMLAETWVNEEALKAGHRGPGRCIASGCMAWRWEPIRDFSDAPIEGYCGLAGRS